MAAEDQGPTGGETTFKMALAAIPFVGGSLAVLYDDVGTRRRRQVELAAEASFERFSSSPEALVLQLQENTRLAMLFVSALEAASRTAVSEKARALGLLLADAAERANFDEIELLILALADLEAPHIAGLRLIEKYRSDDELLASGEKEEDLSGHPERDARLAAIAELPEPVRAALLRHGLINQRAGYDIYIEGISQFGRRLLEYLRMAAHQ